MNEIISSRFFSPLDLEQSSPRNQESHDFAVLDGQNGAKGAAGILAATFMGKKSKCARKNEEGGKEEESSKSRKKAIWRSPLLGRHGNDLPFRRDHFEPKFARGNRFLEH